MGMQNTDNKKILVITHQLSRTGAPIVLLDMIRAYWRYGYQMEMITMLDGELRGEIEKMGIPIKVQEHFMDHVDEFLSYAGKFDFVIANTLVTFEAIHLLKHMKMPVLWWLHEGRQYFEYFVKVLPDFRNMPPNIHVYSVGHYVQKVVEELYGVRTEILHFGIGKPALEDARERALGEREIPEGKACFLTAGTYSKVKAQDVQAEAIRKLPEEYLARAEFFFCGNERMYDEAVFIPVRKLCTEYANVTMLGQLSRQETMAWMRRCDCLIAPSRIDPMPTVAAEVMMAGQLCLCTDVCGVAHYIEDGVNGFTVPPEDADALAEKIKFIIDRRGRLEEVKKAGHEIYESHFSMEVFEDRILRLAAQYLGGGA